MINIREITGYTISKDCEIETIKFGSNVHKVTGLTAYAILVKACYPLHNPFNKKPVIYKCSIDKIDKNWRKINTKLLRLAKAAA